MRHMSPSKTIVRDVAAPFSRSTVKERRGIATVSMNCRAVTTLGSSGRALDSAGGTGGKRVGGAPPSGTSAPGGGNGVDAGDERKAGLGGVGGGVGRRWFVTRAPEYGIARGGCASLAGDARAQPRTGPRPDPRATALALRIGGKRRMTSAALASRRSAPENDRGTGARPSVR
jgi:hypothetical protein